ncbi:hypothetical protein BA195_07090 [Tenacibaculum soleae]|uniref:Aerotolerance regulator N-terminal domain-containing protein n=1 Tax=Tenacibaculum soleae TaxID=447689 RepID=A0A1B9Y3Y6_9FLAO|nr:BatA domain-containing protein [Tenacibaculum soleae]OCK44431.1 hypothetical protein BA195_07090 [Tenacibaculum soleae]
MQFKNPEILYFLGLLIIPIIVHLFQLQRFVKTPFTNVAFLKKIALQTRKSSRIKKWLILATRMLLFTALIIAFAQPYFGNRKINEQQHFFIYIDNSLSTNAKGDKGNLLQVSAQEIIENISKKATYSLLTNNNFYKNKTAVELKDILLQIKNTAKKKSLESVSLKISSVYNSNFLSKNIIISDFQNTKKDELESFTKNTSFVKLSPQLKDNLAIDSVFVNNTDNTNFNVVILVKNQGKAKTNIPIALYNKNKLVNKQLFSIKENSTQKVTFSILKSPMFLGKIALNYNDTYNFDNSFYFSINPNLKTTVLNIGKPADFISKIYTEKEFTLTNTTLKNLDYNLISKQNLIVLNEIDNLPKNLSAYLTEYSKKGGTILIIPAKKIAISSYNNLFNQLKIGQLLSQKNDSLKITTINYKHPLLNNVFEKSVNNFQYPFVKTSYVTLLKNASTIVSFDNKQAFIQQINTTNSSIYWVASPLNKQNSNFTNSPLIVPVFYNIGKQSSQPSELYYLVNKETNITINKQLDKNEVVTVSNTKNSFIPLQQTLQNSIKISLKEQPLTAGFYQIKQQETVLKNIAFNYPKEESSLYFLNISNTKPSLFSNSIQTTLKKSNDENKIQWLWKWFLVLAIVSLLIEILILKFFKP